MADIDDRRAIVTRLYGAAGRELKDAVWEGYAEALKLMPTSRLVRVVEHVLEGIRDMTDPADYKPPAAGVLWKISRGLRALPAPPPLELHGAPPALKLGDWDAAANTLLLNYVTLGLVQKAVHGQQPTRDASRYAGRDATAILLRWKRAWATEMREDRELYGGKRDGKALWLDYMRRAEADIDQLARIAA